MDYTDILTKIRRIVRSVNLESKRIEKEHGISIPQLLTLNFLNSRPNFQASHKELKDYLQLNASTVTGIISRLEKKGLVARLPKQNDKRVALIVVTAKGAETIQDIPEPLHELLTEKLRNITSEKLQELYNAFDVIIDFLDIENIEAAPIITGPVDLKNNT